MKNDASLFSGFNNDQIKFIKMVYKLTNKYKSAPKAKRKDTNYSKALTNGPKLSITRTKIFNDSYRPKIYPQFEILCRLKASTLINLTLAHGRRSKLKIFGEIVRTNTSPILNFIRIKELSEATCACCGIKAKHAYLERDLKSHDVFIPRLYGVRSDKTEIRMTIDHKVPRSKGGHRREIENLQILCQECNNLKHTMDNDIFIENYETIKELAYQK